MRTFLIVYFALSGLITIWQVGKPRKPITAGEAAIAVAGLSAVIYFIATRVH